jgi:hypothetical protein
MLKTAQALWDMIPVYVALHPAEEAAMENGAVSGELLRRYCQWCYEQKYITAANLQVLTTRVMDVMEQFADAEGGILITSEGRSLPSIIDAMDYDYLTY